MKYIKLGKSNLEVSVIAMGCRPIVGDATWGPQKLSDAIDTINTALSIGVNFFDTAESYGDGYSEEILGKALLGKRDKAIIATKVSPNHLKPKDIIESCEKSLKRLRTNYIDLYYIHFANWEVPIEDTFIALEKLKKDGKIRAIGCCNFGKIDLMDLLNKNGWVEINQLCYSLLFRAIEYEVLPLCIEKNIGIACYAPLAQGLLTGIFESLSDVPEGRKITRFYSSNRPRSRHNEAGVEEELFNVIAKIKKICDENNINMIHLAISWLLSIPGVKVVITGTREPKEIIFNAKAVDVVLSNEIIKNLKDITEPLKQKLGKNIDLFESKPRSR